jgi:hypothetical protein
MSSDWNERLKQTETVERGREGEREMRSSRAGQRKRNEIEMEK